MNLTPHPFQGASSSFRIMFNAEQDHRLPRKHCPNSAAQSLWRKYRPTAIPARAGQQHQRGRAQGSIRVMRSEVKPNCQRQGRYREGDAHGLDQFVALQPQRLQGIKAHQDLPFPTEVPAVPKQPWTCGINQSGFCPHFQTILCAEAFTFLFLYNLLNDTGRFRTSKSLSAPSWFLWMSLKPGVSSLQRSNQLK